MNKLVYCDESCHLEKDLYDIMVLGAITCDEDQKKAINNDIRNIKIKHNLNSRFEIKWTKVSNSKYDFYKELIDYFFSSEHLWFRGIVARGKKTLNNTKYNEGNYDIWYDKMYYQLLSRLFYKEHCYRVFIDRKDTKGGERVKTLHKIICRATHDYSCETITSIKQIESDESEVLQLTDLIIGAIGYHVRKLDTNEDGNQGKLRIVQEIGRIVNLDRKTPPNELKFNLFFWDGRG